MSKELPSVYSQYIHRSRYARYLPEAKRRETWGETVSRYTDNVLLQDVDPSGLVQEDIRQGILNLEIMPSMRALMTAGEALDRDNVAGYNCAYVAVDNPRVFDEILYILMCGTGVGFSVERQYISQLPEVAEEFHDVDVVINVPDSKIGWAANLRQLISLLYSGQVPTWNLDKLRPSGAPLKTFGGRSSGPEPLDNLFKFTVGLFKGAAGRKLTSIEAHDLVCKIAEVVVCGGVRRSALLSLSNLTDERMRTAKSGQFWNTDPQRTMANNSVCYTEKPDLGIFLKEWINLYESKSGERGIFARYAAQKCVPDRRDGTFDFGTNPCSEIILRSKQFCNLTEVVIRPNDTLEGLKRKVRLATIMGTCQATFTDFRYLSKQWKKNTEEERLLGVSLTGIMDHPVLSQPTEECARWLTEMKEEAIKTNEAYANKLGINPATAITCVKPSGTVSQLVGSSSGIHDRFAPFYIRRVRADKKDPLCQALVDAGVPHETDNINPSAWVFEFPVGLDTNEGVRERYNNGRVERSAMDQLRLWRHYNDYWCEHKPSCTIFVKDHEWLEVATWVYDNFDSLSGISFFPYDGHVYSQAPYERITAEAYAERLAVFPNSIDFDSIEEVRDETTASQELACVGGQCEL